VRAERQLLRAGDYLVGRACRRLPRAIRAERCRERAAELPVILNDPRIRFATHRAVRMLGYAAGTFRAVAVTGVGTRRRPQAMTAVLRGLLLAGLGAVGWDSWNVVQAPGHPLNYLRLAWGLLLVAYPISILTGSGGGAGMPIVVSGTLLGVAVNLWAAAQGSRDWVNYFAAALLVLLLLALCLARRWARARQA
jgi:hypothetical protein